MGEFSRKHYIEHGYFRTYDIASLIEDVAANPFAYLTSYLQYFTDHDAILAYLEPWRRDSALHIFTRSIAHFLFDEDTQRPDLMILDPAERHARWVLPIDAALHRYGIDSEPFFPSTRDPHGRLLADANAIEDRNLYQQYFDELRGTSPYERLLEQIADEVFFVMFTNRSALAELNKYLATRVSELDPEWLSEVAGASDLAAMFRHTGRLKRRAAPRWARQAVFYRDRGRCAQCGLDLSFLIDVPMRPAHFDHIIPLAEGGLNDITNLQLLCESHNLRKGRRAAEVDQHYRRWYDM